MKAPEKIYLQWTGPEYVENLYATNDITWCADKINDEDLEYHLAPSWVSVEDRLPHLDAEVWMKFEDGETRLGFYDEFQTEDMFGSPLDYDVFTDRWGEEIYTPIAWCYVSLPAPPEENDD